MSATGKPSTGARWYQFDLRLFLVVIAAVCVVLGLEAARRPASKVRGLRDIVQVGESAEVRFGDRGVMVFVGGKSNGTVTEVGEDFLALKVDQDSAEAFVPFNKIELIRRQLSDPPQD